MPKPVSEGVVHANSDAWADFYRRMVEGMRCAIVTLDRAGRLTTINNMACTVLQLERDDVLGKVVEEALGTHPRLAAVLRDALDMSNPPNRAELELKPEGRQHQTIGFTVSPIENGDTRVGIAIFFKDLTQVEQQEEQQRLRDRLVALGQMAASLAHEIRNPLASIEVTATLLKRRLGEDHDDVRLVDKIADEVARLNNTVTRGLEFARPLTPERMPHDVSELMEAALTEAENRFAGHQVQVERVFDPDAPQVLIDGQLIKQVLVNLIVNAFEAVQSSGQLRLQITSSQAEHGRDSIEIRVQDDGPGIAREMRGKIFYPFATTKADGSGIGLAMARKIVECHHGMIDVEDAPGGGTIFRLRLASPPADPS